VLNAAERSLEFYDGADFAVAEAWSEWDKRAAALAQEQAYADSWV
jgi:hypothetical protein